MISHPFNFEETSRFYIYRLSKDYFRSPLPKNRFKTRLKAIDSCRIGADRMVNEIPPQEQRKFVQLYKEGYGVKRIARKTGFSYSGIRKPVKEIDKLMPKIKCLYQSRLSCEEIAKQLGLSTSTIRRRLKEVYGYTPYTTR